MSYIFFENVKTEVEVGKNAKSGLIILVKNQKCLSEKNQAEGRFLRNDSWLLLTKKPAFDPFKNLQSTSIPLTLFCLKKWRFLWQVIEKKRWFDLFLEATLDSGRNVCNPMNKLSQDGDTSSLKVS